VLAWLGFLVSITVPALRTAEFERPSRPSRPDRAVHGRQRRYRSPCPPSALPNSSGRADPPAQIAPCTAGSPGTDHRARPPNRRRDAND